MPKGIPNKRYTPGFKKLVVETMQKENDYREGYGMMGRERIMYNKGPVDKSKNC